ncbi:MAG: hypothetical protein JWQ97_983 [Phenylobacterium sp.]|nr:hypothetical protein [Phenylobacterium sp.]
MGAEVGPQAHPERGMRNPVIEVAADMFNAIAALKLKRHTLRSTPDGVEIHQPGRPTLLLTYRAAHDYAAEVEEASNS